MKENDKPYRENYFYMELCHKLLKLIQQALKRQLLDLEMYTIHCPILNKRTKELSGRILHSREKLASPCGQDSIST